MVMDKALRLFLRKTFDIRNGEVLRAIGMMVYLFLIITTLLIVKPTVNGLFLSKFGVENLPYAFMMVALSAVLVTTLYAKIIKRIALNKVIHRTLIFSVVSLGLFGFFLNHNYASAATLYLFYIWVSIFALVVTSQFWILANIIFNAREAKRLFGFIAAGGIAGGIFGGYFTTVLTQITNSENLPYCAGFILALCIPINHIITTKYPSDKYNPPKPKEASTPIESHPITLIKNSKHLTYLALIVGISVMVAKLVDYQFGGIAARLIPDPDELTGFIGFWMSTFSVISLILQLFLTRRVIERYGVSSTLLFLPGTITIALIFLVLFPGLLAAAVFLKMADGGLKQSLNKAAMELLIMPISTKVKNQTKIFIDVVVDSIATGISGIILLLLVKGMDLSTTSVNVMIGLLLIAWFYLIKKVKKEYLISFRNKIDLPNQSKTHKAIDFNDVHVINGFLKALTHDTEEEQISILQLTKGHPIDQLYDRIVALLASSSDQIKVAAIRNLFYFSKPELLAILEPYSHHENEDVRIAAFEYLVNHDTDQEAFIQKYLHQPNYKIRGAALISLAGESINNAALAEKFKLVRLIQHNLDLLPKITDVQEYEFRKITTIKAICRGRVSNLYPEIIGSLQDHNLTIARHTIEESSQTLDTYFMLPIFKLMKDTVHRQTASNALILYQDEFTNEIEKLMQNGKLEEDLTRQVPGIIKHIGTTKSVAFLLALINEDDFVVRQEALRGLNHLKNTFSDLSFDEVKVEAHIARELQLYEQTLEALSGLIHHDRKWSTYDEAEAKEARLGLINLLTKRLERNLERIFRLLGLNHTNGDIYSIYKSISSNASDLKYSALEFMDNIISSDLKKRLIPIVESSFHKTLTSETIENLDITVPNEYTSYEILLNGHDTRIKLAVLYLISQCSTQEFAKLIEEQKGSEDLKIRNFLTNLEAK